MSKSSGHGRSPVHEHDYGPNNESALTAATPIVQNPEGDRIIATSPLSVRSSPNITEHSAGAFKGSPNVPASTSRRSSIHDDAFWQAAKRFRKEGTFSDLTIVCEGKELKVHRVFVCGHSRWFEDYCRGEMEEVQKSTVEVELDLEVDFYEVIERMIGFCYDWDYDDTITTNTVPTLDFDDARPATSLELHAHLYAAANRYQMPDLKRMAFRKFRSAAIDLEMESLDQVLPRITYMVYKHLNLYGPTCALKDVVVDLWITGGIKLFRHVEDEMIESLMRQLPRFACYLTDRLMEQQARFMDTD